MYTLAVFNESVISIRGVYVWVIKADTKKVAVASTTTVSDSVMRSTESMLQEDVGVQALFHYLRLHQCGRAA